MKHDVWVEVNLDALKHNLQQVRAVIGDQVRIMAVVKANGYGHGYVEPSRAFVESGADSLAVTRIEEALTIRRAGIGAPILLLAPIQPENAESAVEADLEMTVTDSTLVRAISEAAVKLNRTAHVHVKIDTGMGRLGLAPDDAPALFQTITLLPNVSVAGTYTHFATAAEPDITPARNQLELFRRVLMALEAMQFDPGRAHAANSAATLRMPDARLEMVRLGTILYGQYPSPHVPRDLDLKPTWKLKARICQLRDLPSATPIGYGYEYVTKRRTRTAVIPIGFADGFTLVPEGPIYRQGVFAFAARKMRRFPFVEVRGQQAPVIGRVAMQMTILDVTNVPGVEVGDEVTVPAMRIPTNPLLPRVYKDSILA
ncbi:MAG: alanine racemase [Armatimonadetes bacterium]|nr:alanine racemase [Armatimonadota bacterium]